MVGRGTRKSPCKRDCRIIDVTGRGSVDERQAVFASVFLDGPGGGPRTEGHKKRGISYVAETRPAKTVGKRSSPASTSRQSVTDASGKSIVRPIRVYGTAAAIRPGAWTSRFCRSPSSNSSRLFVLRSQRPERMLLPPSAPRGVTIRLPRVNSGGCPLSTQR